MVRAPDGTRQPASSVFAGISWEDPGPVRESSRKLQIGAPIELLKSLETELADLFGLDFAVPADCGFLDPVRDRLEVTRVDVPLVRGTHQATEKLLAVEGLAAPIPLDHHRRLGDCPLEGGEAPAALRALAA